MNFLVCNFALWEVEMRGQEGRWNSEDLFNKVTMRVMKGDRVRLGAHVNTDKERVNHMSILKIVEQENERFLGTGADILAVKNFSLVGP